MNNNNENTTLQSYDTTAYTPPQYPSYFDGDSEEFIDQLHIDTVKLSELLISNFPTIRKEQGVYVEFEDATTDQFQQFIQSNPRIAIKGLLAACQLTHGMLTQDHNIAAIPSSTSVDSINPESDGVMRFIELCNDTLSTDRHIESILLPYFRHRERHERGRSTYSYNRIYDSIPDEEFSYGKGTKIPGQPNVVVTPAEYDIKEELPEEFIAANAIRTTRHELLKRAKVIRSRLKDTQEEHPHCHPVLLIDLTEYPTNTDSERYKAAKKAKITDLRPQTIENVFFTSEVDDFISYCRNTLDV